MKWIEHKNISEDDLRLLAGTNVAVKMIQTRLVITYEPKENKASYEEMGLFECSDLYHVRHLQGRDDTIEILFADDADRIWVKQRLAAFKMGQG